MESMNALRGEVHSKFRSVSEFERVLGWGQHKAARIINGVQSPTAEEIEQMASALSISDQDYFVSLFFPTMFTK